MVFDTAGGLQWGREHYTGTYASRREPGKNDESVECI